MPIPEYIPEELACEEWRPLPKYEDLYDISDLGRYRRDGRILTPQLSGQKGKQYYRANPWRNNIGGYAYIHRLVAIAFIDNPLYLPEVDHKDRDRWNNRRSNLRWCLSLSNHGNQSGQKNKTSIYKGVFFDIERQAWIANITMGGTLKYIGAFRSPEAAAIAYDQRARAHWGEFALENTKTFGLAMSVDEEQEILERDRIARTYLLGPQPRLTGTEVQEIRAAYSVSPSRQTVADLALLYNRSGPTIRDVVAFRTWKG